jgi:hypothetical protein
MKAMSDEVAADVVVFGAGVVGALCAHAFITPAAKPS